MSGHVVKSLSAYLDRELPDPERHAVEAHLQLCDECTRYLEDLASVDELARALPLEVPGGYFEALPARVRFKVTARQRRLPRLPAWSWALAAALLLAVITPALLERSPSLRSAEVARSLAPAPAEAPAAEEKQQAARPQALPTAGPVTDGEQRARALRDEPQSAPVRPARALPAPTLPLAPAPIGGAAQGTLASNAASAPLAKSEGAADKDAKAKEVSPQDRTARSAGAPSAAFAPPPEAPVEGPAGQHLYEPKVESDEGDAAPAAAAESKKTAPGLRPAGVARRDAAASGLDRTAPRLRFRDLEAEVPHDLEDARRLRERWRAFVAQDPASAQADEGRVRTIEMGVKAWRLSNDPADLTLVKNDGLVYLRRDDAAQGERVRALLATLGN